jgi:hypothetical protein
MPETSARYVGGYSKYATETSGSLETSDARLTFRLHERFRHSRYGGLKSEVVETYGRPIIIIPLEDILFTESRSRTEKQGMLKHVEITELAVIWLESGKAETARFVLHGGASEVRAWEEIIEKAKNTRTREVSREKAHKRVTYQVVVDFSSIQSLARGKGIILDVVSCPYCGADLHLPKVGTLTDCNHCGKQIHASDVQDRIAERLGL